MSSECFFALILVFKYCLHCIPDPVKYATLEFCVCIIKKITSVGHVIVNGSLIVSFLPNCTLCFSSAPSEAPLIVNGKALSATEAVVWWVLLSHPNIDGYQVSRNFY